jgi:predicted  nucleic acid-binding Zn-ribbon protein
MDINLVVIVAGIIVLVFLTYILTNRKANKNIGSYKTIQEAITESEVNLANINISIDKSKETLSSIENETKDLQALKGNAENLASEVGVSTKKIKNMTAEISTLAERIEINDSALNELMGKLDLYTRIDEFVENGHFEIPEYLYETSARFTEEIKRVRLKQKDLIKDKLAVEYPSSTLVVPDKSHNKKILDGQVKLMLTSFNIECDALIDKVSPSSFPRTLERIEKLANALEKSAATLNCGFNLEYVKLKYEECQLQYQFTLKKQEEQDEQRSIREQIREEQKAIKEYEKAILAAEKEERMYRDMLDKAREELSKVSDGDRVIAEQRIADLEQQLAEAEAKEERAKSMAEQTRKGHVYVISNVGSFGEDVYKIGLTRRLEPMDRVKELGDASVPFSFDVHAMIYVEDAPALETALHREFTDLRVNAVNLRKEFFRADLQSIKKAVERIAGIDAEFKMTALAADYYESRRLQGSESTAA